MTNHSTRQHALLSPSSSYRWLVCPGSKAGNLMETEAGEAAAEGTRLHELAESILKSGSVLLPDAPEIVVSYVETVADRISDLADADLGYVVDHEVHLESKDMPDKFHGTVDTIIYDPEERELTIIDLKTGRRPVYAKGNTQLACYLLLALDDPRFSKAKHFTGIIVSPHGVDVATFDRRYLTEIKKKIKAAAKSDERVAGGHCEWCPLLPTCNEAQAYTAEMATILFDEYDELTPEVVEERMSIDDAKKFIEWGPVAVKLAKWAKMHLAKLMYAGNPVPGWKLGVALKNREWVDPAAAEAVMRGFYMTDHEIFKYTLLTPAQTEARLGKDVVGPLTKRDARGLVAVPERSKLQEYVHGRDMIDLFDEIGGENE